MTNEEKKKRILEAFAKIVETMSDEDLEHYAAAADIINEIHDFWSSGPSN